MHFSYPWVCEYRQNGVTYLRVFDAEVEAHAFGMVLKADMKNPGLVLAIWQL